MTGFVLCLGCKGSIIKECFLNYRATNSDFTVGLGRRNGIQLHGAAHGESGWRVTLADAGERAMTGTRIKRAAAYLDADQTFASTYGDGVSDVDLREALALHRSHGRLATLTGVRPPSRFGELASSGGRVTAFSEKPQVAQKLINGGFFFFFERGFLEYLTDDEDCVLERAPLERCPAEQRLFVHSHLGYWQCMDRLRGWESLQKQWNGGTVPWRVRP